MIIRHEQPEDETAIWQLIKNAFGQAAEADLVDRLRIDGDAVISLVAMADRALVGHVMFSRMTAPFRALGMAPVSVAPEKQRAGVGHALIQEGLKQARQLGWDAIFVLGDPAYYGRFGFRADLAAGFSSPYAGPHFAVLALASRLPTAAGAVDYAPAFAGLD